MIFFCRFIYDHRVKQNRADRIDIGLISHTFDSAFFFYVSFRPEDILRNIVNGTDGVDVEHRKRLHQRFTLTFDESEISRFDIQMQQPRLMKRTDAVCQCTDCRENLNQLMLGIFLGIPFGSVPDIIRVAWAAVFLLPSAGLCAVDIKDQIAKINAEVESEGRLLEGISTKRRRPGNRLCPPAAFA